MPMTIEELLRELEWGRSQYGKPGPQQQNLPDVGSEIGGAEPIGNLLSRLMMPLPSDPYAIRPPMMRYKAPTDAVNISGVMANEPRNFYANTRAGIPFNIGDYTVEPGATVEFLKGKYPGGSYDNSRITTLDALLFGPQGNSVRATYKPDTKEKSIGYTQPIENGAMGVNYSLSPEQKKMLNFFLQKLF